MCLLGTVFCDEAKTGMINKKQNNLNIEKVKENKSIDSFPDEFHKRKNESPASAGLSELKPTLTKSINNFYSFYFLTH